MNFKLSVMKRRLNRFRILIEPQLKVEAIDSKDYKKVGATPNFEKRSTMDGKFGDRIFECNVYISQLQRLFGEPPEGSEFVILQQINETEILYDVCLIYTTHPNEIITEELIKKNEEYASQIAQGLECWDDYSKTELIDGEHHLYIK